MIFLPYNEVSLKNRISGACTSRDGDGSSVFLTHVVITVMRAVQAINKGLSYTGQGRNVNVPQPG